MSLSMSAILEGGAFWLLLRTPIDVGYPPGTSQALVYASGATVWLHYPALRLIEFLPRIKALVYFVLFSQGWLVVIVLTLGLTSLLLWRNPGWGELGRQRRD